MFTMQIKKNVIIDSQSGLTYRLRDKSISYNRNLINLNCLTSFICFLTDDDVDIMTMITDEY